MTLYGGEGSDSRSSHFISKERVPNTYKIGVDTSGLLMKGIEHLTPSS